MQRLNLLKKAKKKARGWREILRVCIREKREKRDRES